MAFGVTIRSTAGDPPTASSTRRSVLHPPSFTLDLVLTKSVQAYLEFFVSPELLETLISHIERDPSITYYVINKRGDLRTNNHSDGPNAVTWGVFPGKEIIQPTIVEAISFMAWKVSIPYFIS